MAHHIYTTHGFILTSYPSKESDKVMALFTRDLGLVFASARGVRKTGSRLTNILCDLNLVKVSLVRGKRNWRLTTATLVEAVTPALRGRRKSLASISRISNLVSKLVRGEDKNVELFNIIEESIRSLVREDFEESNLPDWELLVVAKLLSSLGYLSKDSVPKGILEAREDRKKFLVFVNEGIHASGLS